MKFPDFLLTIVTVNCLTLKSIIRKERNNQKKKDSLSVPLIKKEGMEPIKQNQINMLMGKLILS